MRVGGYAFGIVGQSALGGLSFPWRDALRRVQFREDDTEVVPPSQEDAAGDAPAQQFSGMRRGFGVALLLILFHSFALHAQAVSVAAEIFVSVPDQELVLLDRGKVIVRYPISTSKFGVGDGNGTYRTPLGTLFISGKFGDRLASGAVIKSRVATGEIVDPNAPGRDAIVSRVIWLRGKEQQNRAAHDRCIYIHGTPEERRIGKPASFGCIRMRSKDVIALYQFAHVGMHVTVTQKRIGDLLPPEEPSLLARAD